MFEYLIFGGLVILAFYGLYIIFKKMKSMEDKEGLAESTFIKEFGEYFIVDADHIIAYSKSMENFLLIYYKGFKFFKFFDKTKSKETIIQNIKLVEMEDKSQKLEITLENNEKINIDIDKKIDRNCGRSGEFKSFEEFYNKYKM